MRWDGMRAEVHCRLQAGCWWRFVQALFSFWGRFVGSAICKSRVGVVLRRVYEVRGEEGSRSGCVCVCVAKVKVGFVQTHAAPQRRSGR